jgi:hypothetical protein
MRATPQMGVFQHPAKTKAWHPNFECQAFEFPTTHLPYGGSFFNQGLFTSARMTLISVPFFKKKIFPI